MGMLAATLRYGAKPLFWFGIIFAIMFLAYAQFFYLIYHVEVGLVLSIHRLTSIVLRQSSFDKMSKITYTRLYFVEQMQIILSIHLYQNYL